MKRHCFLKASYFTFHWYAGHCNILCPLASRGRTTQESLWSSLQGFGDRWSSGYLWHYRFHRHRQYNFHKTLKRKVQGVAFKETEVFRGQGNLGEHICLYSHRTPVGLANRLSQQGLELKARKWLPEKKDGLCGTTATSSTPHLCRERRILSSSLPHTFDHWNHLCTYLNGPPFYQWSNASLLQGLVREQIAHIYYTCSTV